MAMAAMTCLADVTPDNGVVRKSPIPYKADVEDATAELTRVVAGLVLALGAGFG